MLSLKKAFYLFSWIRYLKIIMPKGQGKISRREALNFFPTRLQRENTMIIINVATRYILPTRLQREIVMIIINVTTRYIKLGRPDTWRYKDQMEEVESRPVKFAANFNFEMLEARKLLSCCAHWTPPLLRRKCKRLRSVQLRENDWWAAKDPLHLSHGKIAVCSVRISQQLRRELSYRIDQEYFWTDRKVSLGT